MMFGRKKEIEAHIIHQRSLKKLSSATDATKRVNRLLEKNGITLQIRHAVGK